MTSPETNQNSCRTCYQFKLRWRTGDGVCWWHHRAAHLDDAACPAYEARTVFVDARPVSEKRSSISDTSQG